MTARKGTARLAASAGALLAVFSLPIHAFLPHAASVLLAGALMALIAGVYVGFALVDGRRSVIVVELLVALGFLLAAVVGLMGWPGVIIAAYGLHGLWDWAHHRWVDTRLPRWYIPLCAVYDLLVALGLAFIWYASG